MALGDINFSQFSELMKSKDVKTLYMKPLAENDNSKNQVYFGPDFSSIQILPNKGVVPDKNNFKAKVDFYWLDDDGNVNSAPNAQLILYPDYPEVRFSGFLQGATNAPSALMNKRLTGRVMFLGISDDDKIIGYVTKEESPLVREIRSIGQLTQSGVFVNLPLQAELDPRTALLKELKRINRLGWINAKRLTGMGIMECLGQNCGGLTLEAELGIVSNSKSEPDYLGYEVKQYNVTNFSNVYSGSAITLMTPEPQGGIYKDKGVIDFIKKFGYPDKDTPDRMNFSGLHYVGVRHQTTKLMLELDGYDARKNKIINTNGAINLVTKTGKVAAAWNFSDIISHWSRKHNQAVYVPSNKTIAPRLQFHYGHIVLVAERTDPLFLLKALTEGKVYYDPGIKLENISSRPKAKRRSQFRIKIKDLNVLYKNLSQENLVTAQL